MNNRLLDICVDTWMIFFEGFSEDLRILFDNDEDLFYRVFTAGSIMVLLPLSILLFFPYVIYMRILFSFIDADR